MKLPIEIVPNSKPQKFRWKQTIKAPGGNRIINHEGVLPVSVEQTIVQLIESCKLQISANRVLKCEVEKLKLEIEQLKKQVKGHVDRIAVQSEIITKKIEAPQPQPKKGK